MELSYRYDGNGNKVDVRGQFDGESYSEEMRFDFRNRITNVDYADGRFITYCYDKVGNRVERSQNDRKESYQYDSKNCLINLITEFSDEWKTVEHKNYEYDLHGNLIEMNMYSSNQQDRAASTKNKTVYCYNGFNQIDEIIKYQKSEVDHAQETVVGYQKNNFDVSRCTNAAAITNLLNCGSPEEFAKAMTPELRRDLITNGRLNSRPLDSYDMGHVNPDAAVTAWNEFFRYLGDDGIALAHKWMQNPNIYELQLRSENRSDGGALGATKDGKYKEPITDPDQIAEFREKNKTTIEHIENAGKEAVRLKDKVVRCFVG